MDIREYDVPYHVRVAIDNKLNVGHWYRVKGHGYNPPEIHLIDDEPDRPVSFNNVCPVNHCRPKVERNFHFGVLESPVVVRCVHV